MEKVKFKTEDGVEIVGNFYPSTSLRISDPSEGSSKAILLLHMMPAVKESWEGFAQKLVETGWNVLAIDLRGHGESVKVEGRTLDYRQFSDEEHQASMLDIQASQGFLEAKDLELEALVGASIGANLALWYQSEHPRIKKTVLLSAGFYYKGIETKPLASKLRPDQGVYLAGGAEDVRASGDSCADIAQVLFKLVPGQDRKIETFQTEAHGTGLFDFDPTLIDRILVWLG